MKTLITIIILILNFTIFAFPQDSSQKEDILNARESEKGKEKRRKECSEMSFEESIKYNMCFESYPSKLMIWGKGFSNGLAKITVDGKAGFINTKGEIVIKPTLKDAGRFSEGLAPFENKNGKWGYIDTKGNVAIKPQFDWAISFSEGLALVQIGKLWGYIDNTGKIVITPKFEEAESFSGGFAVVGWYDKDLEWMAATPRKGRWVRRFINKKGGWGIEPLFDDIRRGFIGGVAIVTRNRAYSEQYRSMVSETYVIDDSGKDLWELTTSSLYWFSDDVMVIGVGKDNGGKDSYSFVDRSGKIMTDKTFSYLTGFSEGLSGARATWTGKHGFIDKTGDFVIEPRFQSAKTFSEGLAGVKEDHKGYGFIDKSGTWVIEPQFRWVDSFQEGFALVTPGENNLRWSEETGYVDKTGKFIWEPTK